MLYGLSNNFRAAIAALGFVGAMALPPWVPLLAMIVLSLRFAAWEVIAIGTLVDFFWFTPSEFMVSVAEPVEGLANALPLFTFIGLALVWCLEPLRRELLT